MSWRGGANNRGARGNYSRGGRGGVRQQQQGKSEWVNDYALGPRNECQFCGQITEEKYPQNGGEPYYLCQTCNVCGRPSSSPSAAPIPTQNNAFQSSVSPNNVASRSTSQALPPSSNPSPNELTSLLLEDIYETQRATNEILNRILDVFDAYIASKGVTPQQVEVMAEKAEKEAEVPEKQQEEDKNDLRRKFMALKRRKINGQE